MINLIKSKIIKIRNLLFLKLKYRKYNCKIHSFNLSRNLKLYGENLITKNVAISENVSIGKYTYLNSNHLWIIIESNCKIGKFCSIGPGVIIGLGKHKYDYVSTHPFLYNNSYGFIKHNIKKPDDNLQTIIGNDVWIGANANIKRGIKIGDGAIVGMNAVVTKDVPPYAIVAGVPAKIIKYRFDDSTIRKLVKIKWWDYDDKSIFNITDDMYDIKRFVERNKW